MKYLVEDAKFNYKAETPTEYAYTELVSWLDMLINSAEDPENDEIIKVGVPKKHRAMLIKKWTQERNRFAKRIGADDR